MDPETVVPVAERKEVCRPRNRVDDLVDRFTEVGLEASAASVVQPNTFTNMPTMRVTIAHVLGRRSKTMFTAGLHSDFPTSERARVTPAFIADCDEIAYIVAQWKEAGWQ